MQNIANIQTKPTHPTRKLLALAVAGEQHLAALAGERGNAARAVPRSPASRTSTSAGNSPPAAADVQITDTEHTRLPHAVLPLPSTCIHSTTGRNTWEIKCISCLKGLCRNPCHAGESFPVRARVPASHRPQKLSHQAG